ncbi:MAG: complex I subunit 4 family protein [Candidatus Micrarchaeia archaeon]
MLLIPLIVLLPLAFLVPLALLGKRYSFAISAISAVAELALVIAAMALARVFGFAALSASFAYLPSIGIGLSFGMNAFTQVLALMTSVVMAAAALSARNFIKESQKLYNALLLLISASTFGVFLAGNFVMLYVFWEISEIAMFFVIYAFGGYNRRYASIKFLIFSLASSMLLLIGIMLIYSGLPAHTFDIGTALSTAKLIPQGMQTLILSLLLLSFMIKMPVFPLHAWLPDAYSEAPASGTMVLAGAMAKFGGYGMLLAFLMLPVASQYSAYIAIIFAFSAVYAGFVAIRQANLKTALAYASMVDMGIVALGLSAGNALGYAGALYAMFSHGIVIALMFLIAGTLDESFGTVLISKLRGVAKSMSSIAYSFLFGSFAMLGIPLTSGFIGDLLVFSGAVHAFGPVFLAPLLGLVLIGLFMFWLAERVFFNTSRAVEPYRQEPRSALYAVLLLACATIIIGVMPALFMPQISAALAAI